MKYCLPLMLFVFTVKLNAQTIAIPADAPTTRALIIGIADYKDSLIGDLHYANKDAEIFSEYLRSEAGGALLEQDIWLMTNKEATLGAIDNALNWLIKETKKGDKVVIYFSGHGDVERKTLWQRGYLLTHNTPAYNYRNNAIRVEELDEIVKTLSIGNEAKVIVILDACRSGKMATAGPSLTAEQLEKQVENEVRILSCKSDQKSLEGELWGNGRGLFSFYLVNGLKGLADKLANDDQVVTFEEMKAFLEKSMSESLQQPALGGRRQNPVFVGDERFELAKVEETMLASAAREMGFAASAEPTVSRRKGVADKAPNWEATLVNQFREIDCTGFVLDSAFQIALDKKAPSAILAFFAQKLDLPLEDSEQTRTALAARLHDQVQDVINAYLRGDAGTLDQRHFALQAEKYVQYPRMLQAAWLLLPEGHLLRRNVEVKLHYFDGVCTRLAGQMSGNLKAELSKAFAEQKKALALDGKAAYIHNELGLLYLADDQLDSAEICFKTAAQIAPRWALPHANLCAVFAEKNQLQQAILQGDSAIQLQPDYFGSYVNLGHVHEMAKDLLQAESKYRMARALNDPHYLPFERRALLMLKTGRYEEAEWQFYEMELRKNGVVMPIKGNTVVATPAIFYDEPFVYPSLSGPGILERHPTTAEAAFLTGKYYFEKNEFEQALPFFKQAMRLNPEHLEVYYYLGTIGQQNKDYEAAEYYFNRLNELRPEVEFMPFFLAAVYHKWQRPKEEELIYNRFLAQSKDRKILTKAYLILAKLLHSQKRYPEEELLLWGFHKLDERWASMELSNFYYEMVTAYPNSTDWLFRHADFNYKYSTHYSGINRFEALLKLDSTYAARAYIHALAGSYYLNEGKQMKLSETDTSWMGEMPKAIYHLQRAVALEPVMPSAKYDLARACTAIFEYDEALAVLRSLRDSNDLNLDSRLRLADLEMRSGNFQEADELLFWAANYLPGPNADLTALSGKLLQLKGEFEEAITSYKSLISHEDVKLQGELSYSIARLYAMLGDRDNALLWLNATSHRQFDHKLVKKHDPAFEAFRNDSAFDEYLGSR